MPGDPVLEARLARSLLAGQRALVLLTEEDERALALAEALSDRLRWPLHTWSVAAGVDRSGRERELGGLLARLAQAGDDEIWLLFEAGRELRSSAQRRLLRELAQAQRGPTLILVESEPASAPGLPELAFERLALPDRELLRERVVARARALQAERPAVATMLLEGSDQLAASGLGLSLRVFERTLGAALLVDAPTRASIGAALTSQRVALCGRTLEPVDPDPDAALIGFDGYLAWLRERALLFDPAADRAGLRPRAAVGLVGVPGCGHRLAARVSASILGLPLLRLDRAALTNAEALFATLTALERVAPVLVWIDESSHARELVDELSRRLSQLDLFTIVTATDPDALPSRWRMGSGLDALFFVDLPSPEVRAQLLAKLLANTSAAPLGEPIEKLLELARLAHGCSAGDLARALTDARLRCFAEGRPLAAADLELAFAERSPIATREQQRIEALRKWAEPFARSVALA